MAAVLSPKSFSFPHNILQDSRDSPSFLRMERPSPPRPSLPSISSLIEDVDKHSENGSARSPIANPHRSISGGSHSHPPPSPDVKSLTGSVRNGMPPTPPLPGTASFDFSHRPSTASGSPSLTGGPQNGYFPHSPVTSNPDAYAKQRSAYPPIPELQHWHVANSPTSSRRASGESTARNSEPRHPDLAEAPSPYSGLAQQRPLPANFPPPISAAAQQLAPIDSQMTSTPYQHHHHYSAASSPSYSPTTDRYQCPTCQKAFSRPSSLKIHMYSHTGEKPFKCKHEGCGKFFSVRSNMKRHEKGCHGVETSSNGGNSPQPI